MFKTNLFPQFEHILICMLEICYFSFYNVHTHTKHSVLSRMSSFGNQVNTKTFLDLLCYYFFQSNKSWLCKLNFCSKSWIYYLMRSAPKIKDKQPTNQTAGCFPKPLSPAKVSKIRMRRQNRPITAWGPKWIKVTITMWLKNSQSHRDKRVNTDSANAQR